MTTTQVIVDPEASKPIVDKGGKTIQFFRTWVNLMGRYMREMTDGGNADAFHTHDHDTITAGTIAAHDTSATGAELDTLTDGSNADSLHDHAHDTITSGTIADHDTSATGAELDTLTDDSMADTLHRHSELSASDGTPNPALKADASGNVVLLKTEGVGLKIDQAAPTFGWMDLLGDIKTRPAAGGGAAAQPDFAVYRGNIYGYSFNTAHLHECFVEFHLPHDYVTGTDIFLHAHWSQNVVDTGGAAGVPGVCVFQWDVTYAKGHGTAGGAADPFIAEVSAENTQQGSTTQYGHLIAELQMSAASPSASQLDSDNLEVDGLILVRMFIDPAHGTYTLDQNPFIHYIDIHYQSTMIATKQKAPPFYT